jgi:predicted phosphoribosyltransferase
MKFASREDAGQRLGQYLKEHGIQADVVLGLPRGGVVVAAQLAHILHLPLGVLVVRKIGHPWHREFAVGALAENGVVVLDEQAIGRNPLIRIELNEIIREETERLNAYHAMFHQEQLDLVAKSVLLVDDGIATGATTEAAVLSAKNQQAAKVTVASPVASASAVERLQRVADEVCVLCADADFDAVGRYYESFTQTTDEEVIDLLKAEMGRHV